ncbi:MAG: ribonuclease P protein component [Saprospiraceae bacterium]
MNIPDRRHYSYAEFSILHTVDTKLKYPNSEKLKSRKLIAQIFAEGRIVKAYPIRIHFLIHSNSNYAKCQAGVSVSKRNFNKAVDRNRLKRQLREAYRLNQSIIKEKLLNSDSSYIAMMIIFGGKEKLPYQNIENAVVKAMSQINIPNE